MAPILLLSLLYNNCDVDIDKDPGSSILDSSGSMEIISPLLISLNPTLLAGSSLEDNNKS